MLSIQRIISSLFFLIFLFVSLSSCSGLNVIPVEGNVSIDESVDGASSFEEPTTEGGSTTAGNPGVDLPVMGSENVDYTLISSPDSKGRIVFQAISGAFETGHGIAVRNTTKYSSYIRTKNTFYAKMKRQMDSLFSQGYELITGNAYAEDTESTCFSDDSSTTILTVNDDGSVNATALENFSKGDELSLFYYDVESCSEGESQKEDVNEAFIYLAQMSASSNSLTFDKNTNTFFHLDDEGHVMQFKFSEGTFIPQGEFDEGYLFGEADSSFDEVHYNDTTEKMIFKSNKTVSVEVLSDTIFESEVVSSAACAVADGCSPTQVKTKFGSTFFGIEFLNSTSDYGKVLVLEGDTDTYLEFIDPVEMYEGEVVTLKSTHAFDVFFKDGELTYDDFLVSFVDGADNLRLFAQYKTNRALSNTPTVIENLSDYFSVQNIGIIQNQNDAFNDLTDGSAYLVVNSLENNRLVADQIVFLDYDLVGINECDDPGLNSDDLDDLGCDDNVDGTSITLDIVNAIKIENIIDSSLNNEKSKLFVLADDIVHVIDTDTRVNLGVYTTSSIVGGIFSNFSAKNITTFEDSGITYLLVTSDNFSGTVIINTSTAILEEIN